MDSAALQKYVLRLFESYEVELEADEAWLVTDGDFPAIRASWHEGAAGQSGRLDIDVILSEERQIEESFAGMGGGDAGCQDALAAFERISLPVLLAGCWYVTDARKLAIQSLQIGAYTWDVFIGPFEARGVVLSQDALAGVIEALKRESLTPEPHWLRLFMRQRNEGAPQCEALLDNQPWVAGEQALQAVAWPSTGNDSAHGFLLLDVRDY